MGRTAELRQERRAVLRSIVAATGALWLGLAGAQDDYPSRPVKIVVPYPAGGTTDVITRIYARALGERFGQPFVVENRPGGGTNVGAEAVARAAPDGYTLFVVQAASHGVNPSLFTKLNYDAVKDFAAGGQMARTAMFLVANPRAPFNTVRELVGYARAHPAALNYASQGNGSPGHLAGALLTMRTKTSMVHVPYKGAAQALTDLASGQVQFGFLSLDGVARGLVNEGKLKVLAVAASSRWPTEPEIPSMAEEGVPDFEVLSYFGLSAPAKTPSAALDRLNKAMQELTRREDISKRILGMGLVPLAMSRDEMSSFISGQIEYWRPVVKSTGVTID